MAGCAHGPIALDRALRLDVAVESKEITADNHVRVVASLRNVSIVPVELCLFDGGVSLDGRLPNGNKVPLRRYTTFDIACPGRTKLLPGAVKVFNEDVWLWPGTIDVTSSILVNRPGVLKATKIQSVAVPMTAQPSNNQPGTAKP
jgi:hypothetical protein